MKKENDNKKEKEIKKESKKLNILVVLIPIVIVIVILAILLLPSKKGEIKIKVKSTLDELQEKSDLETATYTYNVIAKKCKNKDKCDLKSNDIDDFEYVISCKGTITAGIEFKNVKIETDEDNKKIIITIPDANITGEPNVLSMNFINGDDIPSTELPNARKLCIETIKTKSQEDNELLKSAKDQAKVAIEGLYNQLIKTYNQYTIEVK